MNSKTRLGLTAILFIFGAVPLSAGDRPNFVGFFDGKAFDPSMKMRWVLNRDLNKNVITISVTVKEPPKVKTKKTRARRRARTSSFRATSSSSNWSGVRSKRFRARRMPSTSRKSRAMICSSNGRPAMKKANSLPST